MSHPDKSHIPTKRIFRQHGLGTRLHPMTIVPSYPCIDGASARHAVMSPLCLHRCRIVTRIILALPVAAAEWG